MKNPAPYLRRTLYALLDGSVVYNASPVPVYENEGTEEPLQVLIKDYSDADRSNRSAFVSTSTQTIEIVSEQQDSRRKDVDEIGEMVMQLIYPSPKDNEVLSGTDFQVIVKGKPTITHLTEPSDNPPKIVRLILRYNLLITER